MEPTGIAKGFVISSSDTWEGGDNSDIDRKSGFCSPSVDDISWHEKGVECATEPLPLPILLPPSERGIIGGQSANDLLMINVYLPSHFFDLLKFS